MLYATKRFSLIFYALLLLYINNVIGQPTYKLPAVINPSPQSQAFTRYGDYPMSDYTGLTDITIPLHTVTGKKLSFPVTMSFHASGRMANEFNGTLGIRWTMNCGGLVTRTVKGAPDEWNYLTPYVVNSNPTNVPTYDELYGACPDGKFGAPYYDSEFDIFNYSLPNGKHGHFILKNENGTKVPMMIPQESLKISFQKSATYNGFYESIDITDVDGTRYRFGKIDASTEAAVEFTSNWDSERGLLGAISTAWYLTKIISSDGTDEISLSYNSYITLPWSSSQTTTVYDRNRNDDSQFWETSGSTDPYQAYLRDLLIAYHFEWNNVSTSAIDNQIVPIVTGIQFQGGSITCNYSGGHLWERMLTDMTMYKGAVPYKKIKFNISNHPREVELYYLDNVSFYGEDQNQVNEKYNFSYYEPSVATFGAQQSAAYKDWWGYFYPASQLLPPKIIDIEQIPTFQIINRNIRIDEGGIDRAGNEDYKKIGMLKSITYPTGGETEFVYEGNRYDNELYYNPPQNTTTLEGPGLRIKEVISRPGNGGKDIHKVYKYGLYEDGRGHINEILRPGSATRDNLMVAEGNAMHFWTFELPGNPPMIGGNNQTGYRTRDYFADPYVSFELSGTQIKYDAVSEYLMEDGVPKQKTTNSYTWGDDEQVSDYIVNDRDKYIFNRRQYANPENAWRTPVLSNKAIYKYNNGQFDKIRNEHYDYTGGLSYLNEAWDMPTYVHTNVAYTRKTSSSGYHEIDYGGWTNTARDYHNNNCSVYGYGLRKYTTSKQLVSQSIIEEQTPNGMISTQKVFDYDNDWNLKSEELVNSKNEMVRTTYTYPGDFPNVPVYQQMVQKNILTPVIETIATVNGVQIKKTATNYYNPSAAVFVPQSVESKTGINPQEVIANFNRYDNLGHVLEQQKNKNVKEVYLWGYQSRYPVAKILNSTYDNASTYISQSVLDGATGIGDDAALRAHLNNLRNIPGALVETYTYKPLIGMTSSTDANGRTTYYEYDGFGRLAYIRDKDNNIVKKICYNYTGQTEACPIGGGNTAKSGTFIRAGCTAGNAGAPITYTVPANTYFGPNADALAQNDVNTNGQAYADKNGPCVIAVYNVAKSGTFTKNNCDGTGVGSAVTYTVPAGRYSSYNQAVADQLAQNDVDSNGHAYANNYGFCTWYSQSLYGIFMKNNCPAGATGGSLSYELPAGMYSSTISQAHADSMANADWSTNGQLHVNANAPCIWYNQRMGNTFYKNDCSLGTGSRVDYVVEAGKYSSTISQEVADQQAVDELNANGQANANANGTCERIMANLQFHNHGNYAIYVNLYNWDTEEFFQIIISPNQTEVPLNVPVGDYEITCGPDTGGDEHHFYLVGCSDSWGGYGAITFDHVYLEEGRNCNDFNFD